MSDLCELGCLAISWSRLAGRNSLESAQLPLIPASKVQLLTELQALQAFQISTGRKYGNYRTVIE